jgi:arsenite transporter
MSSMPNSMGYAQQNTGPDAAQGGPEHSAPQDHKGGDMEAYGTEEPFESKRSVYAGLGWLDRLLVLWILLAIVVGILLGNFVDDVGPALQKGKFVGVSVPIGKHISSRK